MTLDPTLWAKLHGASVHFPIALAVAAALCEAAGGAWPASSPTKGHLRAAGKFAVVLGALGAFPAVASGLFLTRGETLGHDLVRLHHLFVWPAFAGLVGLGAWRVAMGEGPSRGFFPYLLALFAVVALMGAAGYWGGELLLHG